MKKVLLFTALAAALTAGIAQANEKLVIAATPVPHAEILELIKPTLAKEGVDLEIKVFTDYVQPNVQVAEKRLDANYFQTLPYLENFNKGKGTNLVTVVGVHVEPFGGYSKKIKKIEDLKDGATVAIPNEGSNSGRALLLLQKAGVIKLKDGVGVKPSPLDVVDNPKKFQFIEIDAAQSPRALDDVAAAAINTNYATQAGLDPVKDPILRENPEGPYVNVIAVRVADKDKPWVKDLVEAYRSPEVKAFIAEKFKGSVLASW